MRVNSVHDGELRMMKRISTQAAFPDLPKKKKKSIFIIIFLKAKLYPGVVRMKGLVGKRGCLLTMV